MSNVTKGLENLRCHCGKIVCQLDEDKIVIKCRHCKRYIVINSKGEILEEQTGEQANLK